MRFVSAAALAALLSGCGGATSANNAAGPAAGGNAVAGNVTGAAVTQGDAAGERSIPCSLQAHGLGAEVNGTASQGPCDDSVGAEYMPLDELIRVIPDHHPAFYYILARRLFDAGRRDEAVFWFYAGQLRYRIRLSCHPNLRPDTEPALFGSLQETVGRPVNEYGFGDLQALPATMERVLAWDAATRNGFEPKAACTRTIAEQREGMGQLIAQLRANPDAIRRERAAHGLPNR